MKTLFDNFFGDLLFFHVVKKKGGRRHPPINRHRWTADELKEVREIFHPFFVKDKTPGQNAVLRGIAQSKERGGLIWKLPAGKIKKKISWLRLHPPPHL